MSVRFALLGVPLLWFMFVCWAMYYTQSIERFQSKRELHSSLTHQKHTAGMQQNNVTAPTRLINSLFAKMQNFSHDILMLHFLKPPTVKVVDTRYRQKAPSNSYINFSTTVADVKEIINKQDETIIDSIKPENQQRAPESQSHQDFLGLPQARLNLASYNSLSAKDTEPQSALAGGEYTEFVWSINKPKPAKKFIIPGVRFDPPKLGEYGKAVLIEQNRLTSVERFKYLDGWRKYKFNEYASQLISTQRRVPDYRSEECKVPYDTSNLPKASIIICFYNEAWSVLLRTIHSVLTMSPPELLQEIILVDDYSDLVMMHEPLEYYVAQVDKMRLLRMANRSGLVRARLAGVKEAKAPVLIFLDSHVECEEDWLPPLLQVIVNNPNYAVTPEIDVIDHKDFSIHSASNNIGVLTFEGFNFDWTPVLPRIKNMVKSPADPIISPAMAGGLFAIRKDFFLSLETYDTGLELWGGENIELSLKLWLCGGGILIHPCSKVAHIFREDSPYLVGKSANVLVKNSARVAQVWADEYRELYFRGAPYNETRYGSVQEQQEKRKKLQCHTFSWYLDHVYPEMHIPNSGRFLGQITSTNGLCVNTVKKTTSDTYLELTACKNAKYWESTRIKEIRHRSLCMDKHHVNRIVVLKKCDLKGKSQVFEYMPNNAIYHKDSDSCLTSSKVGSLLTLQPCRHDNLQTWTWPENSRFAHLYRNQ
ncbi:hypothetical protein BsWGS_00448 [Bradybaena similaris]